MAGVLPSCCVRRITNILVRLLLVCLGLLALVGPALPRGVELGPAPAFAPSTPGLKAPQVEQTFETLRLFPLGPLTINPQSRTESRNFFLNYYLAPDQASLWTGSTGTCTPGATALSFQDLVLLRVNYFRAMAGVPHNFIYEVIIFNPVSPPAPALLLVE